MSVLATLITILFTIVSVILILLILLQSNRSSGMGFMGAASQTAFGSGSADILTKITGGLVVAFMVMALMLAIIMSRNTDTEALQEEISGTNTNIPTETTGGAADNPDNKPEKTE